MAAHGALAFLAELAAIKAEEHQSNLKEWDELPAFPKKAKYGSVITINGDQIVYASANKAYLYDSRTNEIESWIEYQDGHQLSCPITAFDKISKKLYILGSRNKTLMIVDIHSKKIETHTNVAARNPKKVCLIFANGSLHLIGGVMNSKHYIWNENKKKFKPMCDFRPIYGASVVHIPSKYFVIFWWKS